MYLAEEFSGFFSFSGRVIGHPLFRGSMCIYVTRIFSLNKSRDV